VPGDATVAENWYRHPWLIRGRALLKRRQFIPLSGAALAWPLIASAQQTTKIPRTGYLVTNFRINRPLYEAFVERLRELGYVDGRNLVIEYRDAEGQLDRFPRLAAELARLDPDVIIASGTLGARAVQQATSTIPIVFPLLGDPVGDGFAVSLARPGGNITGLT